jgi:hypothetical protein
MAVVIVIVAIVALFEKLDKKYEKAREAYTKDTGWLMQGWRNGRRDGKCTRE